MDRLLDLVIRGAQVVDGSGRSAFRADVGVKSGRIVSVGNLSQAAAKTVLDVPGLCVTPGFIDMHSHSDLSILSHRKGESSLSQGITTEVVGSCGWSVAPSKDETRKSVLRGLISGLVDRDTYNDMSWSWHSFGEWMDTVDATGIGVNIAPLVGQSCLGPTLWEPRSALRLRGTSGNEGPAGRRHGGRRLGDVHGKELPARRACRHR